MSPVRKTPPNEPTDGTGQAGAVLEPSRWPLQKIFARPFSWVLHLVSEFRHETPREQIAIVYYVLGVSGAFVAGVVGISKHFGPENARELPNLLAISQAVAKTNTPEDAKRATDRVMQIVGELTALRGQQPNIASDIDAAFADLGRGSTAKAESILRKQIAKNSGDDTAERRKRAEYHRYLAAVVFVQSKQDALHELEAGAKADPENPDIWRDLGDVALTTGASTEAESAYRQLLQLSRGGAERESAALMRFGDVLRVRGETAAAAGAYEHATKLIEQQLQSDPSNVDRKHELSIGLIKTGDVLRDRKGDRDSALNAFRRSLAIVLELAKSQPSNAAWQSDLARCHIQIGDILRDKGDRDGALKSYNDGLAIQQSLFKLTPDDALAEREVAVYLRRVGFIQKDRGDFDGALKYFREGQAIIKRLTGADPTNTNWQNDLRAALTPIGDTLREKGSHDEAYKVYQDALGLAQRLAARDPRNTEWQRGLALSFDRIADIDRDRGGPQKALAAYQQALNIRTALVARDPSNLLWQRSLQVGTSKFGDAYKAGGNHDAAVKSYQDALAIAQKLTGHDPSNVLWQCDVAEMLWNLAELGVEPQKNLQAIVATLDQFDQKNQLSQDQRKYLLLAKQKQAE